MAMKGAATGEDVGTGNYGTVMCVACRRVDHMVVLIQDAHLFLIVCTGCYQISAAFKADVRVTDEDVRREVESREDVAGLLKSLRATRN